MKRLGIIANSGKPRAAEVLRRLAGKAAGLGLDLVAEHDAARLLKAGAAADLPAMFERVEAVMALGGDGTVLRAVRELDGRDIPVMGVNIGGLGFLTSVAEDDLECALECLADGNVLIDEWAVAESTVASKGKTLAAYRALNDVVLRSVSSRIVTLDLCIDGDAVTSYVCDGLVVSTPAGSTGHSLSAGGPILTPRTGALVVSLICPHTLSSRPVVVPDRSVISIAAVDVGGGLLLAVDGQTGQALGEGDRVQVRRSERGVRLIHLPGYSYFAVLRQKLHWSGSNL